MPLFHAVLASDLEFSARRATLYTQHKLQERLQVKALKICQVLLILQRHAKY